MSERPVGYYYWEDLGVDHAQYFPGVSVVFTGMDEVYVGVGSTPGEAAEDALESAAQAGWDVDAIEIPAEIQESTIDAHADCPPDDEDCELHYYVALFLREHPEPAD